jgi:hypothetical protein
MMSFMPAGAGAGSAVRGVPPPRTADKMPHSVVAAMMQAVAAASSSGSSSSGAPYVAPPSELRPRVWRFHPDHIASSPSVQDGMTAAQERRLRRAACNHINETVKAALEEKYRRVPEAQRDKFTSSYFEQKMRLPASAAMVLFNRFYMRHSFYRHSRWVSYHACWVVVNRESREGSLLCVSLVFAAVVA